jgi:hypothetical protein
VTDEEKEKEQLVAEMVRLRQQIVAVETRHKQLLGQFQTGPAYIASRLRAKYIRQSIETILWS